jgi:dsRNA-specific ribonuclease
MAHLFHFCDSLPRQPYIDMRPEFSFAEDNLGLITAAVTLPNCVPSSVRLVKGQKGWRTERAAMKDAAFQCYAALFQAGLLNDNLLPLTHGWEDDVGQSDNLPAMITVDLQMKPLNQMAKAWSAPDLHQTRILVQKESHCTSDQLSMTLTTPIRITQAPPLTLYWDTENTFTVVIEAAISWKSFGSDSLDSLREITQLLHQSTHSDYSTSEGTDFVVLFGPDIAVEQLPDWLAANRGRKNALDVFREGQTEVNGFIRASFLYGSPHIFCNWHTSVDSENENALEIECIPLLRRRNFEARNTLSNKSTKLDTSDAARTHRLIARDCTVDALGFNYARFSLLIPAILQHVEAYTVAYQLQKTVLARVGIKDARHIVTAITAPSANWITDYQRYEFIGDAVLKFTTSVQLYADHSNWPEGYLSKRRDSIVSNTNLARAALSRGLELYILTDMPKRRKWSPPRISDAAQSDDKRELGMKVLADVTEALIGAAFLDSGLQAARSCINVFVSEIRVTEPEIASSLTNHGMRTGALEAESLIGYQFLNKILLLEALTHPTYGTNTTTESYQRLEFLGDAVLDVLIVTHLSQCKPALSQGQMTRLKAALVNANLLGFICMSFSMVRDIVRIEENDHDIFTEVRDAEKVQLWRFMRHQSKDIVRAQKTCNERYSQHSTEIQRRLNEGVSYPWAQLARLNPEKFYSDIVESIIGAIFVDSQGSLSKCQQFADRIGLGSYARRMTEKPFDVVHPRDSLQQLAGSTKVEFAVDPDDNDSSLFRCGVSIGGTKIVEVDGCMSRDGAVVVGADAAATILSAKTNIS